MNSDKMFEVAVRCKFRFPYRGMVSTEDLFDLDVKTLDSIFKTLNAQAKATKEESLLVAKSEYDETLSLMIEIVKYIVSVKLAEENERLQAREKKEKKQKIMEILSSKQDEALKNKTPEELQAMLDELN